MWVAFKWVTKKGNHVVRMPMTEKYIAHSGNTTIDVIGLDGREP